MGSRPLLGRGGRPVALALVLLAAAVVWAVDLRRLRPEAFYERRGTYAGARVVSTERSDSAVVRHLVLRNREGEEPAEAYYRRPTDLAPGYRIVLTYAGSKTGAKILELIPERPDVVLMAIQYPYESPKTVGGKLTWARDVRRAAYRTVAGGMLAVSYLTEAEGLSAERIAVVGASLGSVFAVLHGALDDRVPRVLVIHGGGNFPVLLRAQADAWWERALVPLFAEVLVYSFDPVHWVDRIAPRELIVIAARHDERFPLASSRLLYDRAGQPKSWVWTETGHVRSANEVLVDALVEQIDRLVGAPSGDAPGAPS